MTKRRIRNLNSTAFLAFLLLPLFKPASFGVIAPAIDTFFDVWRVISFALIVLMYVYVGRISKIIIAIVGYQIIRFLSTIINGGDYWKLAVSCGTVIGFCMLTELSIHQNCNKYFTVIFCIYFVLITINLVVRLLLPNGIASDDYYSANVYGFLCIDNSIAMTFALPLIGISCIYAAFQGRTFTLGAILLIIIISVTVLIAWSATGVVTWAVLLTYILLVYKKPYMRFFNSYVFFGTFAAMQIALVFLRLQNYFSYIIENILGKSLTLSGRTFIWDLYYIIIAQSPIIGHGVYEGYGLAYMNNKFWYAHNAVLEVLAQTGVFGLVLFLIPFFITALKLFERRRHFLAGITAATIFSFLLEFLTEATITSIWVYGFLVIGANISSVIEQCETYAGRHRRIVDKHYRFVFSRLGKG